MIEDRCCLIVFESDELLYKFDNFLKNYDAIKGKKIILDDTLNNQERDDLIRKSMFPCVYTLMNKN
jgi:hypothetical protein